MQNTGSRIFSGPFTSPGGAAFVAGADDGPRASRDHRPRLETRVLGRRMAGSVFSRRPQASERTAVLERLLDSVILHAGEQGAECLVHRSHADDAPAIHALERRGFLLMDTLLDYVFDFQAGVAPAASPLPPDTRVRPATPKDVDGLVEVARRAFASHSGRFHSDERIPHACAVRVYEEWIRSCVEGWADWVLAAERAGADHRLLRLEETFRHGVPSRNRARALQRRSGRAGAGRPRTLPRSHQRRHETSRGTRAAHRGPDPRRQHSRAARLRGARLARRRRPSRLPPLVEPLNRPGSPYAIRFSRPCLAGAKRNTCAGPSRAAISPATASSPPPVSFAEKSTIHVGGRGSSYLPSDLLAAFLLAQLEAREEIQATRRRLWERYAELFRDWAGDREVRLPIVPADREQPFHMFYLILPLRESRQELIAYLKERGILAVFHYLPLHLSEMGRSFGAARATARSPRTSAAVSCGSPSSRT